MSLDAAELIITTIAIAVAIILSLVGGKNEPYRVPFFALAGACLLVAVLVMALALASPGAPPPTGSSPPEPTGSTSSSTSTPSVSPTSSPTSTPSVSPSSTAPRPRKYLTDLDPQYGDSVALGYVTIAGKGYKHSFRAGLCFGAGGATIVAEVPPGYSQLRGVAGFDDNSGSKFDTSGDSILHGMQIEVTSDSLEVQDRTWIRLDQIRLMARKATTVSEVLPPNTVSVRLSPNGYACSTTMAWGDLEFV
jgi:hypothetical protein